MPGRGRRRARQLPQTNIITRAQDQRGSNRHHHILPHPNRQTNSDTQHYRESDAGDPYFHYPGRIGDTGTYDSQTVTTTNLAPGMDARFTENMHYAFDLNELHHVAPVKTNRPVSALVILATMQRNGSDVYTEKPRHGAGYRLLTDPYTPNQLADRLRRYLAG
jgi:hypothetical protein